MKREQAKEYAEVMAAFGNGKIIQKKWVHVDGDDNVWYDCSSDSIRWDFDNYYYRVKPETKLRPYANAEEFLNAQHIHGPYITWKNNNNKHIHHFPTKVNDNLIEGEGFTLLYTSLIDDEYTWQDGTPCGILED